MPSFVVASTVKSKPEKLSKDLLTMAGVNEELHPFLHMSSPIEWRTQPISGWPINTRLFKSWITLAGVIPVDRHQFEFKAIHRHGFKECSSSFFNHEWHHERTIEASAEHSIIRDSVHYTSKVAVAGILMKPLYQAIFKHRHRKLRLKYGACVVKHESNSKYETNEK